MNRLETLEIRKQLPFYQIRSCSMCFYGIGGFGICQSGHQKTHHEASDGFPLTTLREITILRELQCVGGEKHGIIGLKDVTVSSRYVYFVFY